MASLVSRCLARDATRLTAAAAAVASVASSNGRHFTPTNGIRIALASSPSPALGSSHARRTFTIDAGNTAEYTSSTHTPSTGTKTTEPPSIFAPAEQQGADVLNLEDFVPPTSFTLSSTKPYLGLDKRWETPGALLLSNYDTELEVAIAREEPDLIVRCLFSAHQQQDSRFIASISDEQFTTIIKLLSPKSFIGDVLTLRQDLGPRSPLAPGMVALHDIVDEYASILRSLVHLRQDAGCHISRAQYAALFRNTKALRLKPLAEHLWRMMVNAGVQPDLDCYNGFLGSIISENPLTALQLKPDDNQTRTELADEVRFFHERFKGQNNMEEPGNAFHTVHKIVRQMIQHGPQPNQETYGIYIRAASIQNKMSLVKSTLRDIWAIDADRVIASESQPPKRMAREDPLYPTPQLLFDIVRAYCVNHDVRGAIKLLCFMAGHYGVAVQPRTWSLMLDWAHDLSKWSPRRSEEAKVAPSVHLSTVFLIWDTATSPPFNLKPSPSMFHTVMRSLSVNHDALIALDLMEHYRKRYQDEDRKRTLEAWDLVTFTAAHPTRAAASGLPSLNQAIREWQLVGLRDGRYKKFLRNWLHFVLFSYSQSKIGEDVATKLIPRLLGQWLPFVSRVMRYEIPSGYVEIQMYDKQEEEERRQKYLRIISQRQAILDQAASYVDRRWIHHEPDRDLNGQRTTVYSSLAAEFLDPDQELISESIE